MNWLRTFQIAGAALFVVSLYLLVTDPRSDYFFAAVILMVCAAFLAYRFHIKERVTERQKPDR